MVRKSGELIYKARGFMDDARDAIRGDVVRALIELITNADDAYDAKGGKIEIHLRNTDAPFKWIISVHDHATGLDAEGVEKAFTNLGDQNKKFAADQGTRGLFGRGAKDAASLGKAKFLTVHNGLYSELEISPKNARWSMDYFNEIPTPIQLRTLHLEKDESGLTAELYIEGHHSLPNSADMVKKLQHHVQLRDLLNRNFVTFIDERSNIDIQLHGIVPPGDPVLSVEISVPKYKHKVQLSVHKFSNKNVGSVNNYSPHGLVISGRGAAYENSFLSLTNRPEAGWFCGQIEAPEIHELAQSIDEEGGEENPLNPFRLVSRQRDGLIVNHPYYRALLEAVESHLKPLFDQMAEVEGAERREGKHLRKRFDALSNVLGKALQDILNEAEAGETPGEGIQGQELTGFAFIPPRRIVEVGESVTVTLRVPRDWKADTARISVEQSQICIDVTPSNVSEWRSHERLDVEHASVRLSGIEPGVAQIVAAIGDQVTTCQVIVTKTPLTPIILPLVLEFLNPLATIAPSRRRNLILRSPIEFAGEIVNLRLSSQLLSVPSQVILKPNPHGTHCEVIVTALAGPLEGKATVEASLEKVNALCEISVKESGHGRFPQVKIEMSGQESPPRRADLIPEEGKLILRIFGRHGSLKKIFGQWTEKGFEKESTPSAGATVGEIVAQLLSIYAVEREAELHPERLSDASSIFARQLELMPRFLLALQAGLLDGD